MFVTFMSLCDILVFIKSNVCCTHSWIEGSSNGGSVFGHFEMFLSAMKLAFSLIS